MIRACVSWRGFDALRIEGSWTCLIEAMAIEEWDESDALGWNGLGVDAVSALLG